MLFSARRSPIFLEISRETRDDQLSRFLGVESHSKRYKKYWWVFSLEEIIRMYYRYLKIARVNVSLSSV